MPAKIELSEGGVMVISPEGNKIEVDRETISKAAAMSCAQDIKRCKDKLLALINDDDADPIVLSVAFTKYRAAHSARLRAKK